MSSMIGLKQNVRCAPFTGEEVVDGLPVTVERLLHCRL